MRHKTTLLAAGLALASAAHAEQFANFGQMGAPGGIAYESFPTLTRSGGESYLYSNNIITYFSERGLTGTPRDQWQVWAGATAGYSKAAPDTNGRSWAVSGPNLGGAYYYNVKPPSGTPGSDDYSIYTLATIASVTFPTGSDDNTGFRAGSNAYAYYLGMSHFIKSGRYSLSINPISVFYQGSSRTAGAAGVRGGFSYTVADFVAAYDVTPNLGLGVHHAYQINNAADSSFARSRRGFIGPALSYTGFGKSGIYLYANLNFDYHRSDGLARAPHASFVFIKYF